MSTSDRYHELYKISWSRFQSDCRALAEKLADRKWDRIIGIARGGLVPAALLARELDVHLVDTICVSSYEQAPEGEREQGALRILKRLNLTGDLSKTLIVDDLVDTGKTAAAVRVMFPGATLVTVYAKPAGEPYTDHFISEVSQDTWILFPWDAEMVYSDPVAVRREAEKAEVEEKEECR